MPISGGVLVAVVVVAIGMWAGNGIVHGVKKVGHKVVHVVTLGKK